MRSCEKIIAKLQTLDSNSIEFYDVATRYFLGRFRVIRNCGLFFLFLAGVSIALILIFWKINRTQSVINLGSFLVCAAFGWIPFQIGNRGRYLIKVGRKTEAGQRLEILRQIAKLSFRGDLVGAFILQYTRNN